MYLNVLMQIWHVTETSETNRFDLAFWLWLDFSDKRSSVLFSFSVHS